MLSGHVVLIHGFWSSPTTWERLAGVLGADPALAGLTWHRYGYDSPKLRRWPFSPRRIPDYDDIAQSLGPWLAARVPDDSSLAFVTHSQGGLILQRYLAWMLDEGHGHDLARVRSIVMLVCPQEGSDYLRSLRRAAGFDFHPQAKTLQQFDSSVATAQRKVLERIVHASETTDRACPIPVHVYAGDQDNVVKRVSAQGAFPGAGVVPGDHFSVLDPQVLGNITAQTISRHLVTDFAAVPPASSTTPPHVGKGTVNINNSDRFQVGDGNTQNNA